MTNIHSEIYGQGRTVVMIHGWAMHSGVWREFAQALARHCQVICLDLPGHGQSDDIRPYSLAGIGEALLAAIPSQNFCLIGWSLGASVAIDMASRFPERVDSLLILAGNAKFVEAEDWPGVKPEVLDAFSKQLSTDRRATLLRFLALQVNGMSNAKHLLQVLKKAILEAEPPSQRTLEAGLNILKHSDLRECLRRLKCPVCIINGDKDKLIPAASGAAMRKLNPAINLRLIENAGHLPFFSDSRLLLDIICAVL